MDLVEDESAEAIPRAAINHENIASTSSIVFEEAGDNSSAITVAEMIQDPISTVMTPRVGQAPQLVGREKETNWIISNICSTGNESNNNVTISVCGMAGIGKTALVQSVYLCEDVIGFFTHRAWITMSNSLNKDELIREVLQHFKSDCPSSCSREPLQKTHLKLADFYETNLHNQQPFRCLVVLDGLSTIGEWDLVHSSLLLEDHKVVFRIILTTRELQVANYCSRSNYIYNLSRLHDDDANKLFHLQVFGTVENVRTLPSAIVNLSSLHVLHGGSDDHNKQSGGDLWGLEVPKVIGELRALNTLGTVSVECQGRAVIQKLKNLTQLRKLSVTGITDGNGPDLCSTLKHLSSLQSLTARSDEPNGLSQSLQASYLLSSSLQRLQVLKLYGHLLILPEWILGLRYLFELYLQNTRLQGPGLSNTIDGLARMPSLTTLLLLENSVLCLELVLDRHGFLELELLELSNLGALSFLSFRAGAMPKLKTLQVGGCNDLEKISVVAGAVPKLETLQIENCNGLRSLSYEGAGIEMPMLKNFQVAGCNNLQLLPFVAGDMPYLYTLLIRHCSNLEVFIEPQAVPKLKMLQIDGCKKLHWLSLGVPTAVGQGVSFQMGAMPNLKELQLSGCHGLGRLSFGCGAMPKLETLRIEGCANLLDLSFEAGATPKLETFQINGCSELMELSGLQHLNLKG